MHWMWAKLTRCPKYWPVMYFQKYTPSFSRCLLKIWIVGVKPRHWSYCRILLWLWKMAPLLLWCTAQDSWFWVRSLSCMTGCGFQCHKQAVACREWKAVVFRRSLWVLRGWVEISENEMSSSEPVASLNWEKRIQFSNIPSTFTLVSRCFPRYRNQAYQTQRRIDESPNSKADRRSSSFPAIAVFIQLNFYVRFANYPGSDAE